MPHTDPYALETRTASACHGAPWILAAVLWTVAASLVLALWAGFRQGDWSAFTCDGMPHDNDDHATRSGAFAHLRIRAAHEALTRDGDRFLADHHQPGSRV